MIRVAYRSPSGSLQKKERKVKVLFDYTTTEEDQLPLKSGDILTLLEDDDENWWLGQLHDKVGFFPKSYVEVFEENKPTQPVKFPRSPSNMLLDNQVSQRTQPIKLVQTTKPDEEEEDDEDEDDEDEEEEKENSPIPQDQPQLPLSQPQKELSSQKTEQKKLAKALFRYDGKGDTELELKPGDIVTLLSTKDDEWWEGECKDKCGFFPKSYVQLIQPTVVEEKEKEKEEKGPQKLRALFNYQAVRPTELSIKRGDVITLVSAGDEDWWEGELRGDVGFFPKLYAELEEVLKARELEEEERKRKNNKKAKSKKERTKKERTKKEKTKKEKTKKEKSTIEQEKDSLIAVVPV